MATQGNKRGWTDYFSSTLRLLAFLVLWLRYSTQYLNAFPDDADTLFNVACAYAQKYCSGARQGGTDQSHNRQMALSTPRDALSRNPGYAEIVRTKWTQKGDSFDCLAGDDEFRAIVAAAEVQPPAPASGGNGKT